MQRLAGLADGGEGAKRTLSKRGSPPRGRIARVLDWWFAKPPMQVCVAGWVECLALGRRGAFGPTGGLPSHPCRWGAAAPTFNLLGSASNAVPANEAHLLCLQLQGAIRTCMLSSCCCHGAIASLAACPTNHAAAAAAAAGRRTAEEA